jgi:hypothetical protein
MQPFIDDLVQVAGCHPRPTADRGLPAASPISQAKTGHQN